MSVEKDTSVILRVFNVSDYHQLDMFETIEHTEVPDILLHDASLSLVTSLRAWFCMYGFDYFSSTLTVTFYPKVSADDMTTP